jgi:hypothetical protein
MLRAVSLFASRVVMARGVFSIEHMCRHSIHQVATVWLALCHRGVTIACLCDASFLVSWWWCVQGVNATVFTYGQTGSGKTHTMLGTGLEMDLLTAADMNEPLANWYPFNTYLSAFR